MYHPFLSRRWFRAHAKASYANVTLNRFTLLFFVFSHIYCFAHGFLHSFFFSLDLEYSSLVDAIVKGGRIPPKNMTFLQGSPGNLYLQMCDDVPYGQSRYPCTTIFNSTTDSSFYIPASTKPVQFIKSLDGVLSVLDSSSNVTSVIVFTPSQPTVLSSQCIQILLYPSQILRNLRREDITWVSFQFWLLVVSFLAVATHSLPHLLAVLTARIISTAWALYAIGRNPYLKSIFNELITDPGTPCSIDIFTDYWTKRQVYQITDLALNCTALVLFSSLSCTLLKTTCSQSFKCVGPPRHVLRIHKFLTAFLASIQLEIFVLMASMALWINTLTDTAISRISTNTRAFEALYIITVMILLPWITVGWYAIRYEMKRSTLVFLLVGFVITTGWAIMFCSVDIRWSFIQWPYLAYFTVASFVLLITCTVLGVVCRLNFGKGLKEYLHAESTLAAINFAPDAFPFDARPEPKPKRSPSSGSNSSSNKLVKSNSKSSKFSKSSKSSNQSKTTFANTESTTTSMLHRSLSTGTNKYSLSPSSSFFEFEFEFKFESPFRLEGECEIEGEGEGEGGDGGIGEAHRNTIANENTHAPAQVHETANTHTHPREIVHLDIAEYFTREKEFASGALEYGSRVEGGVGYVGRVGGGGGGEEGGGSKGSDGGAEGLEPQQQQQRPAVVEVSLQVAQARLGARELEDGYTIEKRDLEGDGTKDEDEDKEKVWLERRPVPF